MLSWRSNECGAVFRWAILGTSSAQWRVASTPGPCPLSCSHRVWDQSTAGQSSSLIICHNLKQEILSRQLKWWRNSTERQLQSLILSFLGDFWLENWLLKSSSENIFILFDLPTAEKPVEGLKVSKLNRSKNPKNPQDPVKKKMKTIIKNLH